MVGRRLVPGRARPMSKVYGVTGNVTDLTAQVVGAAVGGVFAGRGQRASFDSLKPIGHDQQLIRYVQLNDSALEGSGSGGVLPGEGIVPLYDYLAALPDDIDISVEAQIPPTMCTRVWSGPRSASNASANTWPATAPQRLLPSRRRTRVQSSTS
jgi:hypothetical protein